MGQGEGRGSWHVGALSLKSLSKKHSCRVLRPAAPRRYERAPRPWLVPRPWCSAGAPRRAAPCRLAPRAQVRAACVSSGGVSR